MSSKNMAEIVAWLIVKWRRSTIRYYSRLPFSSNNELTYSVVRSTSNVLGVESPYCHGVYFARFFFVSEPDDVHIRQ